MHWVLANDTPDLDSVVIAPDNGARAVWRERNRQNSAVVLTKVAYQFPVLGVLTGNVPDLDCVVTAAGYGAKAIWREGYRINRTVVLPKVVHQHPIFGILAGDTPDLDFVIQAPGNCSQADAADALGVPELPLALHAWR